MAIADTLRHIEDRIAAACARCGRSEQDVGIVAVSKTVQAARIRAAVDAGISMIGENRVQEAWQKYQQLGKVASWHLVGHLQTNKVKLALEFVDVIEAVDSVHLAEEINRRAEGRQLPVEVFVEVNTSGEASKFGVAPEKAIDLVGEIAGLKNLKLTGLMTIGAFLPEAEKVRPCFTKLRRLREQINAAAIDNIALQHLSMGMSNDFEVAIEEGATLIRIGRALFGERSLR